MWGVDERTILIIDTSEHFTFSFSPSSFTVRLVSRVGDVSDTDHGEARGEGTVTDSVDC